MRLRVLLVEDSPVDAVMVERALVKGGCEAVIERVDTPVELRAALTREPWDLVLSDYSMPGWTGLDALTLVREMALDLPFIIVSGTIGEEIAVEAMQSGASDYLLKDRLTRLPAAVRRSLAEAELRRDYGRSRVALAFLAQTGVALSQSLDPMTIADTVLVLAVPLLGDAAAVDVLDEAGGLRRVTAGDLEAPQALAQEAMRSLVPASADGGGAGGAWTALPFVLRGAALGCLTLAVRTSGRALDTTDSGVGVELAARAAVALQNARLYEQARSAIATRDEFLQIAAHELRTPLTPLSTHVQTLLRSARAADASVPVSRFDAEIEATGRHVQRLATLVDHLLDVSKLWAAAPRLDYDRFDLAALATATARELGTQASDAGSTLDVRSAEPVVGSWDRLRLEQVLQSLLANAIKFGAGKPIVVTVACQGTHARLEVSDRGSGVAAVDHARIFERFERAVPLHRYGGFGLGLWTAREIVRAHGGTIVVASVPGEGATFTVDVPIDPPGATPEARQNW
jgi:signal transduction histidine kinase